MLGLALVFAALQQGERLDWWRSGVFNGLFWSGVFFLLCALIRRLRGPNPLVALPYLLKWNTVLLGCLLFWFRFTLTTTIILIPQSLAIRGFEPDQIGPAIIWSAVPLIPVAFIAGLLLLRKLDPRILFAVGLACTAFAAVLNARYDSTWAAQNFYPTELLTGVGQAFAFIGLVGCIVLQGIFSGGLSKPQWILTFSAFFHVVRLFGGTAGAIYMGHFLAEREKLHSNLLGLHVSGGNWITDRNIHAMTAGLYAKSSGMAAAGRSRGRSHCGPSAASGLQFESHRRVLTGRLELRMRPDPCRFAPQITVELRRPKHTSAREGGEIMKPRMLIVVALAFLSTFASAGEPDTAPTPRHITLQEAVQVALQHNHLVRINQFKVEEQQHVKEAAKSAYFPSIRNESTFIHVTDTQLVEIGAGSLGTVAGSPIPTQSSIINQGGRNLTTSGTQLTQPLTTLLKIRAENDIAHAELKASRETAHQTENDVALKVHQLYYKILIAQVHRSATEARIRASQDLQSERVEQVKFGSTLEQELIESRAQLLQAKQELLTTDLQLSDLKLQLNDVIGLPLTTPLDLDPNAEQLQPECQRESCVKLALAAHPEILQARDEVEKAAAAVHLAKLDIGVPDVSAFARYSYQDNVPFLARNFGSFGVLFSYDLFDSGRKRAVQREREAQLSQAKENLARLTDEVELAVQTSYNKLERTQQMLSVSEELLATRTESSRVLQQELAHGAALSSQADMAVAQEFDAKTLLLQSQLEYTQANDELTHAIGQTPK